MALVPEVRPDACLVDVILPGIGGFELCERLLELPGMESVPILILTAFGNEEDRARALEAGARGLIHKPFDMKDLVKAVHQHLETRDSADGASSVPSAAQADPERSFLDLSSPAPEAGSPPEGGEHSGPALPAFDDFKELVRREVTLTAAGDLALARVRPVNLYALAGPLGLTQQQLAQYVADFLDAPYVTGLDPADVQLGALSRAFCQANGVIPIGGSHRRPGIVMVNPFDWNLLETVERILEIEGPPHLYVMEPEAVEAFFADPKGPGVQGEASSCRFPGLAGEAESEVLVTEEPDGNASEVAALTSELLRGADSARASDIHIEPKGEYAVVRIRVDGDLSEVRRLTPRQCAMVVARFKALGHMDIAERRKPQDGSLEAIVQGRRLKLRLVTSGTPQGESMVIRLLESSSRPLGLEELGMTSDQAATMEDFAARGHGLVLFVGPTGSGKSTTIFSLLSQIDGARRSVVTIEDPVEYRIPFANQQQVSEKAGVTFESLLKSAVRQDPDILLIGEVRDLFSAKAALDFAVSGHLTLTSLHSANATTAMFRLERLGIEPDVIADATLAVVAQKLLRKLCQTCKRIREITEAELELLAPFTDEPPATVAEPVGGCDACRGTGYHGREGLFEIMKIDADITGLMRDGASITKIRTFTKARGDFLISNHAVVKVRAHLVSLQDAYDTVLADDLRFGKQATELMPSEAPLEKAPHILVVEDDPSTRAFLVGVLESSGYRVAAAADGVEALVELGRREFDLVLADVNMPNLNGLKLLEMMTEKNIETPVVFLTAQDDNELEVRGLQLGASDFLKKPVGKEVLNARLERLLKAG